MLNPVAQSLITLAARVLLAALFVLSGFTKITAYAGAAAYMRSAGVPDILLPLAILTELGGGLLILVGFQTRIVAFLLAGFTLVAGLLFHLHPADQDQMVHFMKNLSIAGGFLALMSNGAGAYSIDGRGKAA